MKPGRALILAATLSASTPLLGDPAPPAATATVPVTISTRTAAPPSLTSPAVLMAKAFRPAPQTCDTAIPGTLPLLAPAPADQVPCMYSPFQRERWSLCPAFAPSPVLPLPFGGVKPTQEAAFIVGDEVEGQQNGISKISGHVQLDQADRRVTATTMTYDSNTGIAIAQGNVGYATPAMVLQGPTGNYDTNKGTGTFDQAEFLMPQRHGHGFAQVFNSLDAYRSELFGVEYTTCPPGHVDWTFLAPDMHIDTNTDTGEAHDVTIHFLGVPIFWTPYLNFPVTDARKSGFLGADFSFDKVGGLNMGAPYYFNLAPNYDDTLYPRVITKRGVQVGDQFRYMDEYNTDNLYGSLLPHDQVYGSERGQLVLKHNTEFNEFTNFNVLYNWVSDDQFFQDLGTNISAGSETLLARHARFTYDDEQDVSFLTQLEDWQTISPFIPPDRYTYRRLPQMVLDWGNNLDTSGPLYNLYGEGVRFQRDLRIGAWRTDLKPSIGLPFTSSYGFFIPTVAWRLTDWDLDQSTFTPVGSPTSVTLNDRHLSRSTPIFDIDMGLYFDRQSGDYIETLEPRIYYLRVPYRNQDSIPIFDTVTPLFSYQQLFTDNRFVGADRQSDANQVSYALSSRILNAGTGGQLLEWDIGQIHYFEDRRVQVSPFTPAETTVFSDVAADILYNLNQQWGATYQQLWSPNTRETDLASVLLQYHPAYHQVVNIGYQFRRPNIKQTDFSFDWPLTSAWSMVGRWNYDIVGHVTLEDLLGFEYDTCCWNFQILHQHYVTPTGHYDNVFFFELQLKGLVTGGRHLESLLQNGILGYSDNDFDQPQPPQVPATQ
ncbi:MAG: LPS assembly protein LptD [Bacillota bacterium]